MRMSTPRDRGLLRRESRGDVVDEVCGSKQNQSRRYVVS